MDIEFEIYTVYVYTVYIYINVLWVGSTLACHSPLRKFCHVLADEWFVPAVKTTEYSENVRLMSDDIDDILCLLAAFQAYAHYEVCFYAHCFIPGSSYYLQRNIIFCMVAVFPGSCAFTRPIFVDAYCFILCR